MSNHTTNEAALLSTMITHWTHEDNLYWSQIRYLAIVQIASISAWYIVKNSILEILLMLGAFAITLLIFKLANIIRINRNVNTPAVKYLTNKFISNDSLEGIKKMYNNPDIDFEIFRYADHSMDRGHDAGYKFQKRVFIPLIIFDLLLLILSIINIYYDGGLLEPIKGIIYTSIIMSGTFL